MINMIIVWGWIPLFIALAVGAPVHLVLWGFGILAILFLGALIREKPDDPAPPH